MPAYARRRCTWRVSPPVTLGPPVAIAALGLLSIWVNYDSDLQRQEFRASNGKKKVWGKKPLMIEASTNTKMTRVTKKSLCSPGGGPLPTTSPR